MMKSSLIKLLVCIFIAYSMPINTFAQNVEIVSPEQLTGLMPASFLDHTGFDVPSEYSLTLAADGASAPPLPVHSLFKNVSGRKTFVGVMIPAHYLQSDLIQNIRSSNVFMSGNTLTTPAMRAAAETLGSIRFPDGTYPNVLFYNGSVYAFDSKYEVVQFGNSRTIGFGFSIGGRRANTISFSDDFVLGASFHLGTSGVNFGRSSGINIGNSFNKLFDGVDLLANGQTAEELIEKTILFTPYVTSFMAQNYLAETKGTFGLPPLRAVPATKISTVPFRDSKETVRREDLRPELQTALNQFKKTNVLEHEVAWQKKITQQVQSTVVLDDPIKNDMIQKMCDHMAQAYALPKEIWPRCKVAASLVPNAWAYPGGDLFFSAGMFGVLKDIDAMMFVVGHEIGHVVGRHTTHALKRVNAFNFAATAVGLVANVGTTGFSLSGGSGLLGPVNFLTWFPQTMAASMAGGIVAEKAARILLFTPMVALMSHMRGNESQADRFGQEIAYAAGTKQNGMVEGWTDFISFMKSNLNSNQSLLDRLTATHPDGHSRAQKLKERFSDFHSRHNAANTVNRWSVELDVLYARTHKELKPYVEEWAKMLRLRSGVKSDAKAFNDPMSFVLQSYFTAGGSCALNALYGAHE